MNEILVNDKTLINQDFHIYYYIIYINTYKNFYKLHFDKIKKNYDSCYWLFVTTRILFCTCVWIIFRIKIN